MYGMPQEWYTKLNTQEDKSLSPYVCSTLIIIVVIDSVVLSLITCMTACEGYYIITIP